MGVRQLISGALYSIKPGPLDRQPVYKNATITSRNGEPSSPPLLNLRWGDPVWGTGVTLDNVVLVPASLLPFKDQWQTIANQLPKGTVLICLPSPNTPQRKTLETVIALLRAKGHQVTTLPAERFS